MTNNTIAIFFRTDLHKIEWNPCCCRFSETLIEFRSQTQNGCGDWQHGRTRRSPPRHVFFRFLRTLNFTIYIRHFTTHVNDHWSTHLFLNKTTTLKTDDSEEKL